MCLSVATPCWLTMCIFSDPVGLNIRENLSYDCDPKVMSEACWTFIFIFGYNLGAQICDTGCQKRIFFCLLSILWQDSQVKYSNLLFTECFGLSCISVAS